MKIWLSPAYPTFPRPTMCHAPYECFQTVLVTAARTNTTITQSNNWSPHTNIISCITLLLFIYSLFSNNCHSIIHSATKRGPSGSRLDASQDWNLSDRGENGEDDTDDSDSEDELGEPEESTDQEESGKSGRGWPKKAKRARAGEVYLQSIGTNIKMTKHDILKRYGATCMSSDSRLTHHTL